MYSDILGLLANARICKSSKLRCPCSSSLVVESPLGLTGPGRACIDRGVLKKRDVRGCIAVSL